MIHSTRFICVLDTNVIYPLDIRDILLWFAHYDLYTPKWSIHIFDEWKTVMMRKGISEAEANKRLSVMDRAFPDAQVTHYQNLIPNLSLPDPKDCHVMAAAIKVNAHVIVTNNLKDFPKDYLASYGLTAKSPDDFLTDIIDLNPSAAMAAFKEMVMNKRNPDLDEYEVLDILRKRGLVDCANYLHSQL